MSEQYPDLIELSGFVFPVYVSSGCEERGRSMAAICQQAYEFLSETLPARAKVNVLVLAPAHWSQYGTHPTYGMPHAETDQQALIMAGEDNAFWQSMVPPLETLPQGTAEAVCAVYGRPDGTIDLSPFFDLLSVHELAHLFHDQENVQFGRKWLQEFFANLCLHAYVATQQPEQLPVLETFPPLVLEEISAPFEHQSLADFERLYTGVGPQNYAWYQCRLHVAAKAVYSAGGVVALQRLWRAFAPISDDRLTQVLGQVHPRLEQVFTGWPTGQS
jgi:hypothetical protein